jgi:predicted patatin/cPLA2 family phospholipase
MTINNDTALVLEGGGMRGVFTCGVLDCFMDHQIRFPYTIGVSAGACNGLSYMSRQRGRAKYSNIDLLDKYNYIGLRHLLRKRNIMDFDLLFTEFPEHILPYDYDAYFSSPERYEMVTTNCLTGEANYFEEKSDKKRLIDIVRASSSLPFVCPITYVDDIPMLDGGIVDSIPLQRAMDEG